MAPEPDPRPPAVRLRAWEDRDAPCVVAASADRAITAVTTVPERCDAAGAAAFIERQRRRPEEGLGWSYAVARVEDDVAVGLAWLGLPGPGGDRARLGYWIVPGQRGRGSATAALLALVATAPEVPGVRRVEVAIEPGNAASLAVARHAGFAEEGLLRGSLRVDGEDRDLVLLSRALPVDRIGNPS